MLALSRCSLPDATRSPAAAAPPISCSAQSVANVGALSRILQRGEQLPEAYRWRISEDGDHECGGGDAAEQLPVIDLSQLALESSSDSPAHQRARDQIAEACREWGAFQVINTGVEERVVERARSRGLELFSLPDEEKLRAERAPGTLFGYGATRMASFFNRLMWSEAFTMMGSPDSNISDYSRKLWSIISNTTSKLNKNNTSNNKQDEFCTAFQSYDQAMRGLAQLVLTLILQGLGATSEHLQAISTFWGMIHMNHYPPCPTPAEAMGLATHTDSSCLTIMHQGNVEGLQVRRGNRWIPVKPLPGAFVIQVGDMLQVMSNNEFKSVVHRAMVNDHCARLSLVYFFTPPPSAPVSPITSTPSLYRCLTWNEYLQAKSKLFMGALDHFLLPLHHLSFAFTYPTRRA